MSFRSDRGCPDRACPTAGGRRRNTALLLVCVCRCRARCGGWNSHFLGRGDPNVVGAIILAGGWSGRPTPVALGCRRRGDIHGQRLGGSSRAWCAAGRAGYVRPCRFHQRRTGHIRVQETQHQRRKIRPMKLTRRRTANRLADNHVCRHRHASPAGRRRPAIVVTRHGATAGSPSTISAIPPGRSCCRTSTGRRRFRAALIHHGCHQFHRSSSILGPTSGSPRRRAMSSRRPMD
jgi:hypothetical protein